MFTKKMTFAACIAVLSATVLATNANAMNCSEMTGNQVLAAIERGQCTVETNAMGAQTVVEDDKWIRTSRGDAGTQSAGSSSGKSGGGYHY